MARFHGAAGWAIAASAAMVITLGLQTPALAAPGDPGGPPADRSARSDVRPVEPDYNGGKALDLARQPLARSRSAQAEAAPAVGESRYWLALDDAEDSIYAKTYTLRGLGDHIQVWVADDRAFPGEDCRDALGLTDITDAQVDSFVDEFDTTIYPTESRTFSTPPDRDGTGAPLPGMLGLPDDYYQVGQDQADDIVVLVDNVRDSNYYAPSGPEGQTYIAGFFYSVFNEYVDRNVMTIDAFDWLHRTGATPPDDSGDPAYQACSQEQGQSRGYGMSRPHLYEGTFAHEYQHLLEYYEDPDEVSWVNEGLSDWAQTLVGYVDPSIPPDQPGADSHLACFQGFMPPSYGGPENSLTAWGDQGGPEVLCDYGAAYSFMEYLHSHYGDAFMTALHREDANGLAGLDAVLDRFRVRRSAIDTVHDWAAAMALDAAIDRAHGHTAPGHRAQQSRSAVASAPTKAGGTPADARAGTASKAGPSASKAQQKKAGQKAKHTKAKKPKKSGKHAKHSRHKPPKHKHHKKHGHHKKHPGQRFDRFTAASLSAMINWDNTQSYDSPGAPPNGSDYVRLRDSQGRYLNARQLRSITFDGARTLEPTGVEWASTPTPPDATTEDTTCDAVPEGSGPAALYSGCGMDLDRSIVRRVSVPAGDAQLSFDALWDIEEGWDFGFVQVSDDDGATWHSLATDDTTEQSDPGAIAAVQQNLPGFTGDSGTWRAQIADLSAYAGQDVLIGFRYVTDPAVAEGGLWIRDIRVGGATLPTTLDGWQSMSQVRPTPVAGFTVQLVGYDDRHRVWQHTLRLNRAFDGRLTHRDLVRALGTRAGTVAAIVGYDDPDEASTQYARYSLRVNGVEQPGG